MNCLEFRRRIGAEPGLQDAAVSQHRAGCPTCARYQDQMRAMDMMIGRALRVDLPPAAARPVAAATPPRGAAAAGPGGSSGWLERRWYALAASLLLGVAIAAALWVSFPAPSLAAEIIDHVLHEPDAWNSEQALTAEQVASAFGSGGPRLKAAAGEVTYARRCWHKGRWVPHLVVRTDSGPVTVLLLAHREVQAAMPLEDAGFSGVVLPAPRGSIAIVGRGRVDRDEIARQVFAAVEWDA
jgi:hypothetical protein